MKITWEYDYIFFKDISIGICTTLFQVCLSWLDQILLSLNKKRLRNGFQSPFSASSSLLAPNAHNEFHKMESQSKIDESLRGLHPKNVEDIADEHACRKVDRMVNAANDSIVHPRRFNAYQCVGKCNIKQLQNVNNYARVTLNMKNTVNSTDGMAACCVPVKLRPIRVLYLEKETVEIRSLDNMIVEECGCYQIFQ